MNFLSVPSKSQKEAITHLAGPAQVIAGPGSGKTFTIIQRILYLIGHYHIQPHKILVITYTKAAANEMKERYEKVCKSDLAFCSATAAGRSSGSNVNFGTFHSICYHILRQSGFSKLNSLIKENEKRKLFQIILGNMGLSDQCTYDMLTNIQNAVSRMKNMPQSSLEELRTDLGDISYGQLLMMKEEYDRYLKEQARFDFDDLITECLRLLTDSSTVLDRYRHMFEYILVDEFQDINLPQYQILKLLSLPSRNLLAVGDDDQAIYGFRGATPGIMKQFMNDFKDGKQILLTENYRSGSNIVKLAEHMIEKNEDRFFKNFQAIRQEGIIVPVCFDTRREEEQRLISEISSLTAGQRIDTGVILRTNREVIQYGGLLKSAGVDVKGRNIADTDIFHGFIMDDVAAFLSYLYEGGRRSDFICFMNKPNRFLARSALLSEKVQKKQMEDYYSRNPEMILEVQKLFRQLSIAAGLSASLAVSFFRKTLGYDRYLRERAADYREYQMFEEQADKVQNCFKSYRSGISVRKFIEIQADQAGNHIPTVKEVSGVSVLTMHGAKGLEFDRVFLPDVNEGIIPKKGCVSKEALEEERRLLYVAITRARNELHIYYTKERGRKLSSFLEGIIPAP